MAAHDSSAALRAHAHPMASPGYGKRSAPDETPRRRDDFAHLPTREASLATLIDRLPDGAAVDAKTLAREHPDYGQAACRTALNGLAAAGHLRRVRERITGGAGSSQWVTRTWFSRTPREDAWWGAVVVGGAARSEPAAEESPAPEAPAPTPAPPPRSRASGALARLGRADRRMTLSATDCTDLQELAAEWLARDPDEDWLIRSLTSGLPEHVTHPAAFARRRLEDKMPPEAPTEPTAKPPLRMLECVKCRTPGRADTLPGGTCATCDDPSRAPRRPDGPVAPVEVHARVAELRATAIAGAIAIRSRPHPSPQPHKRRRAARAQNARFDVPRRIRS